MTIAKTQNLYHEYKIYIDEKEDKHTALSDVSIEIEQGSFVAVLGHNGSGKSTLAKHFNALLAPSSGKVFILDMDTSQEKSQWQIRQTCGMVFQNPDNQIVATIVEEDIAFGLENMGIPSDEIRKRVDESLEAVGMAGHERDMPSQLSGGQKQRIAIAGIIAMKPKIIIFDEPTAMLDPIGRQDVMKIIQDLVKDGITIVLITHFMEEAIKADRIIVMDKGKMVMDGDPKSIFSQVDKIKNYNLELPQVTELCYSLNQSGFNIPADILHTQDIVDFFKSQKFSKKVENKNNENKNNEDKNNEDKDHLDPQKNQNNDYILQIKKLNHIYNMSTPFQKEALKDISIDIPRGSLTGIIGHTGSGKSTLIQHLNSLIKPTSGSIFFNGQDINQDKKNLKQIRQQIGLVFQYPEYQLFETTVFKDVSYGPKNMGLDENEINQRVKKSLDLVGIEPELYEKSPFELSGGQKRRVSIAGILAMEPSVLVLDEPTAGLDPLGRQEIMAQIQELHKKTGTTIILVSHSMEDISKLADQIIVLNHGKTEYMGTPAEVFAHAYELEKIGLAVPNINYMVHELNKIGYDLPLDIFTVEQAYEAIINLERL